MTNDKLPEQFDWVRARSTCSLVDVFRELEHGVRDDLEIAQSLVPPRYQTKFSIGKAVSNRFSAIRVDDPMTALSRSIDFVCSKDQITVYNDRDEEMFAGTLTLNNEGKCRLGVNNEELTQWQFRRMSLEKLLFGSLD
jgi:hypothetical protein